MKPVKRNGCAQPFHRLQVASWLAVALLSALFYALIASELTQPGWLTLTVLYSLSFCLCLVLGLLCTLKDPTDSAVKRLLEGGSNSGEFSSSLYPRLCTRCNTHVGALSKHCNKCNRCTEQFDHHCDWLNNCIGRDNYRLFVLLLGTLEVWTVLELAAAGYVMLGIFLEMEPGCRLVRKFAVGDSGYCYLVALMLMALVCILIVIGNGYLILFHAWLRIKGLSTYDFIMERRKRRANVEPSSDAAFSQRKSENSSVLVELNQSGGENRAECALEPRDHQDATPSGASDFDLRKMFSRTIDNSSLPSCEKPTDMDFLPSNKRRRARESIFSAEENSGSDEPTEQPQGPGRYKTGPLPLRTEFP